MSTERLSVVLPSGSLSERLIAAFACFGMTIPKPDRTGFCGTVSGVDFYQFDRRMVPAFVAPLWGYDAGITGRDLLLASGYCGVREVASFCFSRASDQPTRWVLAKRKGERFQEYDEVRIGCELPVLAEKLLSGRTFPFRYRIERIEGSEEACVRRKIVDMALLVTETGASITANGLEIVEGCDALLTSTPLLFAKQWLPADKEERLQEIACALRAVTNARKRVMMKADVPRSALEGLTLPSEVAPTVKELTESNWVAVEICIPTESIGSVGLQLERAGARAIVVEAVVAFLPG